MKTLIFLTAFALTPNFPKPVKMSELHTVTYAVLLIENDVSGTTEVKP